MLSSYFPVHDSLKSIAQINLKTSIARSGKMESPHQLKNPTEPPQTLFLFYTSSPSLYPLDLF